MLKWVVVAKIDLCFGRGVSGLREGFWADPISPKKLLGFPQGPHMHIPHVHDSFKSLEVLAPKIEQIADDRFDQSAKND